MGVPNKTKENKSNHVDETSTFIEKDSNKKRRTKSNAGDVIDDIPKNIAIITNKHHRNDLDFNSGDKGSLYLLSTADGIRFEKGKLYFKDMPALSAQLKHLYTREGIDTIDLPLLRGFYTIILNEFYKSYTNDGHFTDIIRLYLPDICEFLGKPKNISKIEIDAIIKKISSFQTVMGSVSTPSHPNYGESLLPVLVFLGYEARTNTIAFTAPYLNWLIQSVYNVSIRKDKTGTPITKKDGTYQLLTNHSYVVKSSIVKERNKKAVEIVMIIASLIETTTKGIPSITALEIIESNALLQESLTNTKTVTNKNVLLKRSFKRAWELLETHTDLKNKYPNIVLPDSNDPSNYPTMNTLDKKFSFPH